MAKTKKPNSTKSSKSLWRTNQGNTRFTYLSITLFSIGICALAAAIFFLMSPSSLTSKLPGSITHTDAAPDTQELLVRLNGARTAANKPELESDEKLQAVAEMRLQDMIKHQKYDHKDSSGKFFYDLLREKSYASEYSCENLDIETTTVPQAFVKSWLESTAGHRDCLLHEKVTKVGIASGTFTTDDRARKNYLVVVIFAKPL